MKKEHTNKQYIIICIIFVIALITIAMSISYAYLKIPVRGETTESIIKTGTYDEIITSLTSASAIDASNMMLINEEDIETDSEVFEFTVKVPSTNVDSGKFDIYLKDIAMSPALIDQNFKYQILMDNAIIATGNFSTIATTGIRNSDTNPNTDTMNYYHLYYLKKGINFNGYKQSTIKIRLYLLNDSSINQNSLLDTTFSAKVGIESYLD